ncbi:hypothetical protein ABZX51_010806 [Aspergillus tubingensis]
MTSSGDPGSQGRLTARAGRIAKSARARLRVRTLDKQQRPSNDVERPPCNNWAWTIHEAHFSVTGTWRSSRPDWPEPKFRPL